MRLDDLPPAHPAWSLLLGRTPLSASSADQRFSSTLYVPTGYREIAAPLPVLVAVHGTGRGVEGARDRFAAFAEAHGVAVLAPLFPAAIDDPNDVHNYKSLLYRGIRFDEILLGMLDEAAERWRLDARTFLLAGFSGGGQFAHRFALLHPERVRAVSVGAPGRVTLLDDEPWPLGIADVETQFGSSVDLAAVGRVAFQIVVGEDDHAEELLLAAAADPREARAGATRVHRAQRLADELRSIGADVEFELVAGAGHEAHAMTEVVTTYLAQHVRAREKRDER